MQTPLLRAIDKTLNIYPDKNNDLLEVIGYFSSNKSEDDNFVVLCTMTINNPFRELILKGIRSQLVIELTPEESFEESVSLP